MSFLRTTALLGLLAAQAPAQTIDVHDYLPLGVFDAWRMVEGGDPEDVSVVRVRKVVVAQNVVRYHVRVPVLDELGDVTFVLSTEGGELLLHALRLDADVPGLDEIKLPFDPPVLVGDSDTELGVDSFGRAYFTVGCKETASGLTTPIM